MNGFLHRPARRAAGVIGRGAIVAIYLALVACGSGSGGDRRPMVATNPPAPAPLPPTAVPTPPPAPPGAPPATVLALSIQRAKTFSFSWPAVGGATEYQLLENVGGPDFVQVARVPSDVSSLDLPVFLPSKLNALYVLQSCNEAGCAPSMGVSVTRDMLNQAIGYLKPSNTAPDPTGTLPAIQANNDVMDLSADGKTLAFGLFVEDGIGNSINGTEMISSDRENNSGAVYVLVNENGVWRQQAYIKPNDAARGLNFGMAVSLSADGNTLAVGAIEETLFSSSKLADPRGAVYLFSRNGTTWSQQGPPLKAAISDTSDLFGVAVSLADDGNTLAVGALGEDSNGTGPDNNEATDAGAVYVYTREGTIWNGPTYLKASNPGAGDGFGGEVRLSGDGQTLAIGAGGEDSAPGSTPPNESLENSGAIYVFARSGNTWILQAFLKAAPESAKAQDLLSTSISLSRDGRVLAAGAGQAALIGDPTGSGFVQIFVRDDNNNWSRQTPLRASAAKNGDVFNAVSLTDDGNTLVVGALGESSATKGLGGADTDDSAAKSGAAYLFTRNGTTWTQQSFIKASNAEAGDNFGFAVAISGDGSTLAVMAPTEDSNATGVGGNQNDNSATTGGGAVYLY